MLYVPKTFSYTVITVYKPILLIGHLPNDSVGFIFYKCNCKRTTPNYFVSCDPKIIILMSFESYYNSICNITTRWMPIYSNQLHLQEILQEYLFFSYKICNLQPTNF